MYKKAAQLSVMCNSNSVYHTESQNVRYINNLLLPRDKNLILVIDLRPRRAFWATYHEHIRDNNIYCSHLRVRYIACWESAESESIEG